MDMSLLKLDYTIRISRQFSDKSAKGKKNKNGIFLFFNALNDYKDFKEHMYNSLT